MSYFSAITWQQQVTYWWDDDDDDVHFLPEQQAVLDFYSVSSQKQQFTVKHVAPPGHIILIPSQPVFTLTFYFCMLCGEVTNTTFIVFGLTQPGLEPMMIYHTQGERANQSTTEAIWEAEPQDHS